eukprot:4702351-Ditylum_brightwellii.AAC.1
MRVHQHKDNSYSFNQTRYASNIIHKYNPSSCPLGLPHHRSTPDPPDYIYSKQNRLSSKEEEQDISTSFPGLGF